MCPEEKQVLPGACPSAVAPEGSQTPKSLFIATLPQLVPAWSPQEGLWKGPDGPGEEWEAEVEMARLSSLKRCKN